VPETVTGGASHVCLVKFNTNTPWFVVTVNVKLIGVPQINVGAVLNSNGTTLLVLTPIGILAMGEFGCWTLTPGVVLDSTAETPVAPAHPKLRKPTTKLLHSSKLMIPSPFPPETVDEVITGFGAPARQVSYVAPPPFGTFTIVAAFAVQLWFGAEI